MPDSCSLSLSLHSALPSPFHAWSKTSFSIRGQRSFTNRECQSPRPPRGDIFFFPLSFSLSLSLCRPFSPFVHPSLFFSVTSLSLSLSFPVHRQPCRPFPLKFSVADVIVPSLLPVRKNQPRLPLPFDGIGLPRLPNEKTGNAAAVPNRLPNKVRTPPPLFPSPSSRQMLRVVYRFIHPTKIG